MKINIKTLKLGSLFIKTQDTILSAAAMLAAATGVNAVLGLLKGRLLAKFFGVSDDLAVFYTADRIPNLVYSILIVGAVSTVFIPVFTNILKKNKETANKTASSMISATFLFFFGASILLLAGAPQIIKLISFEKFTSLQIKLGAHLMRIMVLSQLLLVAGSLITSILQSFRHFLLPALAPIVYNTGMILGIIFLSPKYGIYGPALGVLMGSLMHFLIQIPAIKKTGFKYIPSLNFKNKHFRNMLTLIPPRIGSVLIANTIQTLNNSFAILISNASVVYLKFANQLQNFPVSLCGFSMAAASLPTLSYETGKDSLDKFKRTFSTAFHQTMFMVMPLSAILLILRVPTVRLVYGVSNFPWEATIQTARTLGFFSVSIFAQSANYLLTRAFYALRDTLTPVLVSTTTAVINVILSLFFISRLNWGVWAVALSFSITSIIDSFIHFYLLNKKLQGFEIKRIIIPFSKISVSTLLMAVTLYTPMKLLDQYVLDTSRTINLIVLTATAALVGILTYLAFTKLFKVREIELLYKFLRKIKIKKISAKKLKPESLTYPENQTN